MKIVESKNIKTITFLLTSRSGRASKSSGRGRSTSSSGGPHKVTFTDKSEIHEIPPKPKRVPKEKRSKSAPGSGPEPVQLRRKVYDVLDSKADSAVSVEQFQRASVTSVEDLLAANGKAVVTNADYVARGCKISDQDIHNLNKVKKNKENIQRDFKRTSIRNV